MIAPLKIKASELSDTDLERRMRAFMAYSLYQSGLNQTQIAKVMYNKYNTNTSISKQRVSQLVRLGYRLSNRMCTISLNDY